MCHRPRPLRVGNPKLFLRLPLLRSSSHRHARSLRTSALDYARNFTSESRLSPRTASNGLPPCGTLVPMPKRNLKIVKRTPIALAICEACNMHFHSKQPVEDNAEIDMKIQFTKHKCKPVDSSQGALRIVREATENK